MKRKLTEKNNISPESVVKDALQKKQRTSLGNLSSFQQQLPHFALVIKNFLSTRS